MAVDMAKAEKLVQAARDASPGQKVTGLFLVEPPPVTRDRCVPPRRQRPVVLREAEVPGAPWSKFGDFAGKLLTLDFRPAKKTLELPSTARDRADFQRASTGTTHSDEMLCHAFGANGSQANKIQLAAHPRSKASVTILLCATPESLKLLYVPYSRDIDKFANVVEVGWQTNRRELEWTRSTAWKRGNQGIQYGFTDGSWASLFTTPVAGQPAFTDVFPHTLSKEDPIPPHPDYTEPEPKK